MKKYLFSLICIIVLSSCNENSGYQISGSVDNNDLNGNYIYLYEYGIKDAAPLDSALIQDGKFIFKGVLDKPVLRKLAFKDGIINKDAYFYFAGYSPYTIWFLLENTKLDIRIEENSSVSGSVENEKLTAFMREMDKLESEAQSIDQNARNAEEMYNEIFTRREDLSKSFISNNNNSLIAAAMFYDLRHLLSEEDRRTIINNAGETFLAAPNINKIVDHLAVLENVAVGKKFTDFKMAGTDGNMHNLSEYAGNGKIVLIDFWASWCPPCRRDMPYLVEVYETYKDRGFEIVGISLDSDKSAWEKGIRDLNITWPQLSDLNGWQNEGAALYGVNSIPHTVLLDRNGKIIDKNIHAASLKDKIEELLK